MSSNAENRVNSQSEIPVSVIPCLLTVLLLFPVSMHSTALLPGGQSLTGYAPSMKHQSHSKKSDFFFPQSNRD